jgi:hypothetical protein
MRANTHRILPATTNAESREKRRAEDSSSSALSAIVHVIFLTPTIPQIAARLQRITEQKDDTRKCPSGKS